MLVMVTFAEKLEKLEVRRLAENQVVIWLDGPSGNLSLSLSPEDMLSLKHRLEDFFIDEHFKRQSEALQLMKGKEDEVE